MKKSLLIIISCTLLGACSHPYHSLIKVSWEQEGKNCVYTESYGEIRQEWDFEQDKLERNEYIVSVKTMKYGNTSCEKIIDFELKNKTNKSAISNQFHEINSINNTHVVQQIQ